MISLKTMLARGFNSFRQPAVAHALEAIQEIKFLETEDAIDILPTPNIGQKAVAKRDIPAGTCINEFWFPVFTEPSMHTVQINERTHVSPTRGAEYISHGCEVANTRILIDDQNGVGRFFVTKNVLAGDDLFFNYNTTEWDLSCPFKCECPACLARGRTRVVKGFKHLSLSERLDILEESSPCIRSLAAQECLKHVQALYQMEKNSTYYDIDKTAT